MTVRPSTTRRRMLRAAGTLVLPAASMAQTTGARAPATTSKPLQIVQIVDTSAGQIDVSKDFLVGSRAAWQEASTRTGSRSRSFQHQSIEVDGSRASVAAAVAACRDNPGCVAVFGTVGDTVASQVAAQLKREGVALAHVAPWLQNSTLEVDERTFPIFAARQEQIAHALKSLAGVGMQDVGAVFASPEESRLYLEEIQRVAAELKLRLQLFGGDTDPGRVGQRLTPQTPAVLLFIGGTPELAQFTQGLERQARQRYVVALADVNLQTLAQMGAARNTPVIATQPVPMVTAGTPIVRQYREVLSRLFDEPPTALSLAGFIAARYALEVLGDIDGTLTRASVLSAFQRRSGFDLGGFRVAFDSRRRSAGYVTQSMLTADGRVVG